MTPERNAFGLSSRPANTPASGLCPAQRKVMAPRKPNILLITCDQWRGDSLSTAGTPWCRTPNADALASEGVLFARHYGGRRPARRREPASIRASTR